MPDLSLVFDLLARDKASPAFESVGDAAGKAGEKSEGFGKKLEGVWDIAKEAALPAGLAVGAAFFGAIEQNSANTKLAAQLNLNPAEAAEAGKLAGTLYSQNYGESLDAVNEAIGAVQTSIKGIGPLTGPAMQTATKDVLNFASAFGVDAAESTQIVGQLITNKLVPDASAGFDLLTAAYQKVPAAMRDELPDILNEYGTNFRALGFTGQQAFGLLTNAAGAGKFVLDKTGDALKEFTIRGSDMSTTSVAAYQAIGLNAAKMSDQVAKGGPTAQAALQQTASALLKVQDPAKRANLAISLFGTPLEDLSVDQVPQFLGAISKVGPGMTGTAGAAAQLDKTLSSGVGPTLDTMKRTLTQTAIDGAGALIKGFTDGKTSAGGWQGGLQNLAALLSSTLMPALDAVGGFLTGTVAPALGATFGWLTDHQDVVVIVGGLIAAFLIPQLVAWGVQSTIAGVKSAGVWLAEQWNATTTAVKQGASIAAMVGKWVWYGAQAVIQGVKVAAVWTYQVVQSAVSGTAAFLVQIGRVVGGWVAQATAATINGAKAAAVWTTQLVASAVSGAASFLVQVARVVGGWVLMGLQSMIQAARMAAAWFIALGPVGWVIAAVIGLVALIIANWDRVVAWTRAAFEWVVGAVRGAFAWIVGAVQTFAGWIVTAWNGWIGLIRGAMDKLAGWVRGGIDAVIGFFRDLPGKIGSIFSSAGSWLADTGRNLINGLLNGARSVLSNIGKFFLDIVPGWIRGPFESALGIHSPSTVFAAYGGNIGQGLINGLAAMRPAVAAELAGLADAQAFGSLTANVGGLGYTAPTYGDAGTAGGAAGGHTYITTVSGVASPEQVAAQVVRAQRTNEFLAGASS